MYGVTKSRGLRVPKGTRPRWVTENQGRHLCRCGCGTAVKLRPEHFPNPPRFIHGHNTTVTHRMPRPDPLPCRCGCGTLATPGRTYVSGHNGRGMPRPIETRRKVSEAMTGERNHQFGKRAHNFIGRTVHADGYILIWSPEHPYASNGRVFEHRLVMERHLRETDPDSPNLILLGDQLYLRREIEVHHRDEVKSNNGIGNLRPLTKAEHARLHHEERGHSVGG